MKKLLETIYETVQSGTDYNTFKDLKYMSQECLKTDVPTAVEYLRKLSDRLEGVIPSLEDADKMREMYELHKAVLLLAAPFDSFENGATQTGTSVSYLVRITASALNIRKQPTTASVFTGTIRDKGIYTIVEEASGAGATRWGKLKSGAGWISLDYTKKV